MDEKTFNSLPVEQRKAAQQRLIDLGLYNSSADGKWGAGTKAAFDQERKLRDQKAEAERAAEERKRFDDLRAKELEIKARETNASASEKEAETARKKRYSDDAASGTGLAASLAAGVPALLGGGAAGMGLGKATSLAMDKAQESRNKVLQGVADDRRAGLTTREGAREAARLSGAVPMSNTAMRTTARMLPHMGLGALTLGKGIDLVRDQDGESYYSDQLNRGAGYGLIGAGTGLVKRGIQYGAAPGVAPDAQALAVINSNQLRRNGAGASPGPLAQALTAGSPVQAPTQSPALPSAAAAPQAAQPQAPKPQFHRDAKGRFAKLPKGSGAAGIGAALGYAMTPDRADAATGEPTGNQAEAMTNAGIAGGAAYGTSKLAQALAPALRGGLGMVGEAMAPASIDAMTDYSDADLAQGRNMLARALPQALQGGAVDQARQMATVPERGPQAQMAQDQRLQAEAMPMQSAQALQIPEGIPAPNPDGSSPYGEAIANRINRMVRLGAPPEAIAALLNQAVR
jgi:hypothetical protein